MKVKDVMHKGATCVAPTTSVKEIAKRMRDNDIGAIPVSANGRVVGILTVICCSPDDDIDVAIEVMESKHIRRLPVTDSHKTMIGMLSLGDVSHKVKKELSGEVLRAVSGHHT